MFCRLKQILRNLGRGLLLALLFTAACAPQAPADPRIVPTVPPPAWTESAAPITLDNVASIRYLGRLDSLDEPSTVFAHALAPDGTRLAGLDNSQLLVWDLLSGEVVYGTARGEAVRVFYAPDKTEVFTLDTEGRVRAFDVVRGLDQGGFAGHPAYNAVAAYYPRDGWLALGGLDGSVKVWDPLERQSLVTLAAHRLQVRALAFSDDGRLLATAGEEGVVRVWDWETRMELAAFEDDQIADTLCFAPDSSQLAAGAREVVRLYPLNAGQTLTLNAGRGGTSVLLYAPGGAYLLSGGGEDDFSVWNPQSGALVARLTGSGGQRAAAAFAPDGSMLLTSAMGGLVALWNMTTITSQTVNSAPINTGGASIFTVDWTGDQRLLMLFGARGSVQVWGIGPESGG